jgi:hypothetical protein
MSKELKAKSSKYKEGRNLAEQVVVGVVVERGHSATWPKPRIDLQHLPLAKTAVVWCGDVGLELRDLIKQLMLGKICKRRPCVLV